MSYRDFLVYLDDGDSNAARMQTVLEMAARYSARVTGVTPAALLPRGVIVKDSQVLASLSLEAAEERLRRFAEAASTHKVETAGHVVRGHDGEAAKKLAQYARNFDLVVLRQANPNSRNHGMVQEIAEQVLLLSGRPVFFMPYIGAHRIPCRKTMIAYDGSPSATRAVHDVLPVLRDAEEVMILVVRSEGQKVARGEVLADGLQEHLRRHGVNASLKRTFAGTFEVATVIQNEIADNDIDLLVMGGYGTPSLKQKIFGGITRTLLSSMIVPVIMSH